jgi:predicted GNAT family N-acyltransferase
MDAVVHQIKTNSSLYEKSLIIRNDVLRKPLNLNIYDEDLSDEKDQIHFVLEKDNQILGTVSLVPYYKKNTGKLRQMVTSTEARGKGYGQILVQELEKYASNNFMKTIVLHARHHAIGFYQKLGYAICSEPFEEVGIKHVIMQKELH